MVLSDGGTYEGFVDQKGAREGRGKRVYGPGSGAAAGDVYDGQWSADLRAGEGTCAYGDGRRFCGQWAADCPEGAGVMTYPPPRAAAPRHEQQYDGGWKQGARHGAGSVTYADGCVLRGCWKRGRLEPLAAPVATVTRFRGRDARSVVTAARFDGDRLVGGTETLAPEPGGGREVYTGGFDAAGQRHGDGGVLHRGRRERVPRRVPQRPPQRAREQGGRGDPGAVRRQVGRRRAHRPRRLHLPRRAPLRGTGVLRNANGKLRNSHPKNQSHRYGELVTGSISALSSVEYGAHTDRP
jgi:hypothetical protein